MACKDKKDNGDLVILIKKYGDKTIDIINVETNKSVRKTYSSKSVRNFELEMLEKSIM